MTERVIEKYLAICTSCRQPCPGIGDVICSKCYLKAFGEGFRLSVPQKNSNERKNHGTKKR